jgi:hypothetical protein
MPDNAPAPAPAAGGSAAPAGESTDDIINDILNQQQQRGSEVDRRDEPRRHEREARPERAREGADEGDEPAADAQGDAGDDDVEEETSTTKQGGKHDGDYSDVDAMEPEDRLEQAQAALEKGDLKKALRLALKIKPEALSVDAGKFTALRLAQQRERQKTAAGQAQLQQRQQAFQQEVNTWIERLKPYEAYYNAGERFRQDGDPQHLVAIITGITGKSYDEAQKLILHNVKVSPAQARMQAELDQLKRERQEERARAEQAQQQQQLAQAKQSDLNHIRTTLKGHEVAKIPRFEERVYRVLEKHYNPQLGGLQITVEEAARRVVKAERKRIEGSPFYRKGTVDTEGEGGASPPRLPAARSGPPLRRDSQNNGAPVGEESTDDIIQDIAAQAARASRLGNGQSPRRTFR